MDDMLTASANAVLTDLCTPALVRAVEAGCGHRTAPEAGRALWQQLDALGFLDALAPPACGGAGLRLADCAGVLMAFGQHALPLPAAQTMMARRWLAQAGVDAPRGPVALATAQADRPGAAFVPYGAVAEAMLVAMPGGARLVALDALDPACVQGHANSLDVTVAFAPDAGRAVSLPAGDDGPDGVTEAGARVTAAVMAGAMQRVLDMTLAYVNERQQFGRPIGKFQAIQQQLSVMAEHVAATRMAAQLGCAAHGTPGQRLMVAIAKARASRAAPQVANGAHALVGAMGITAEFDLQLHTRRLHAQRLHYGAESFWDDAVGAHALAQWDSAAHGVIGLSGVLGETGDA